MDRRTAILAFPGALTAIAVRPTVLPSRIDFERCYRSYSNARAVADEYLASDLGDEYGFDIFRRLAETAKALILEPAPDLDALARKLNCYYTEEMYLGTVYGKEASHSIANDGRRLTGQSELEALPVEVEEQHWTEADERPLPADPGFSADEFAERKFNELVERYPDSWRLQSFSDYERLNADLYAAYSVSIDRSFLVASGERLEAAINNHSVKCWGLGTHGDKTRDGFAFVTVLLLEANSFESVKHQFKVNC